MYNKIIFNGETLIDTTGATVIPNALKKGYTAIDKTGNLIDGDYEEDEAVLQSKTVTPSAEGFDVLPDDGYDGLSKITVNPISYTETPNDAGGITVTIGA